MEREPESITKANGAGTMLDFFIIKYGFDLDSQGHIKIKAILILEKSKCQFCHK